MSCAARLGRVLTRKLHAEVPLGGVTVAAGRLALPRELEDSPVGGGGVVVKVIEWGVCDLLDQVDEGWGVELILGCGFENGWESE